MGTKANLGGTLRRLGELQASEALCQEALAARVKLLGEEHVDTCDVRASLEATRQARRRLATAKADVGGSSRCMLSVFQSFDDRGDGTIDSTVIEVALRSLGVEAENIKLVLKASASAGAGRVNYSELLNWVLAPPVKAA